ARYGPSPTFRYPPAQASLGPVTTVAVARLPPVLSGTGATRQLDDADAEVAESPTATISPIGQSLFMRTLPKSWLRFSVQTPKTPSPSRRRPMPSTHARTADRRTRHGVRAGACHDGG